MVYACGVLAKYKSASSSNLTRILNIQDRLFGSYGASPAAYTEGQVHWHSVICFLEHCPRPRVLFFQDYFNLCISVNDCVGEMRHVTLTLLA